MIWVIFHARCTFCPSIFMTKVLQVLPALGDCHLWMTWEWLTSRWQTSTPLQHLVVSTQAWAPNANTASRMIWMGKFWKAPWKWEPRFGDIIIHDAKVMETYMETYQICTFGPKAWHLPRAMAANLLPVRSFKRIKKRHLAGQGLRYRSDILGLGKQEDWCGLVPFLHVLSPPPLLEEIPRYPRLIWLDRFQVLMLTSWCWPVSNIAGSIFKKYQGKKATAHGPKTSRSIATAQNMHNLLSFSEEQPQTNELPWSRARPPHSLSMGWKFHYCSNMLKYMQISSNIWLGFIGYHDWLHYLPPPFFPPMVGNPPGQVQHELPKPTRLRPGDAGDGWNGEVLQLCRLHFSIHDPWWIPLESHLLEVNNGKHMLYKGNTGIW